MTKMVRSPRVRYFNSAMQGSAGSAGRIGGAPSGTAFGRIAALPALCADDGTGDANAIGPPTSGAPSARGGGALPPGGDRPRAALPGPSAAAGLGPG